LPCSFPWDGTGSAPRNPQTSAPLSFPRCRPRPEARSCSTPCVYRGASAKHGSDGRSRVPHAIPSSPANPWLFTQVHIVPAGGVLQEMNHPDGIACFPRDSRTTPPEPICGPGHSARACPDPPTSRLTVRQRFEVEPMRNKVSAVVARLVATSACRGPQPFRSVTVNDRHRHSGSMCIPEYFLQLLL